MNEARMRLVEAGGRTSRDLGAGQIVGQVLVYLYLQEEESSLDSIGDELCLSKASVSIAARQLEQLGLVRNVLKNGDRKKYYRSADNIGNALQHGLLSFVRQKVQLFGGELDYALNLVDSDMDGKGDVSNLRFLHQRISRAKQLQGGLARLLDNPLTRLLGRIKK